MPSALSKARCWRTGALFNDRFREGLRPGSGPSVKGAAAPRCGEGAGHVRRDALRPGCTSIAGRAPLIRRERHRRGAPADRAMRRRTAAAARQAGALEHDDHGRRRCAHRALEHVADFEHRGTGRGPPADSDQLEYHLADRTCPPKRASTAPAAGTAGRTGRYFDGNAVDATPDATFRVTGPAWLSDCARAEGQRLPNRSARWRELGP